MINRGVILNRVPFSIPIGCVKYNVFFVDSTSPALGGGYGVCSSRDCSIYLDKTLNDGRLLETYYHEVVHALMFETSMSDTIQTRLGEDLEVIVDLIGKMLCIYMGDS